MKRNTWLLSDNGGLLRDGQQVGEHSERGVEAMGGAGPAVQAVSNGVQFVLAVHAQIGALGQVLEQPVGVLAGAALPGAVRGWDAGQRKLALASSNLASSTNRPDALPPCLHAASFRPTTAVHSEWQGIARSSILGRRTRILTSVAIWRRRSGSQTFSKRKRRLWCRQTVSWRRSSLPVSA